MRPPRLEHPSARRRGVHPFALCSSFVALASLLSVTLVVHGLPSQGAVLAETLDAADPTGAAPNPPEVTLAPSRAPRSPTSTGTHGAAPFAQHTGIDDHSATLVASAPAPWAQRLATLLADAGTDELGEVGVYVRHLGTGAEFARLADESWYLASGIKVPVAVAVLRRAERGTLGLETEVLLEASDFVDGTGHTNRHAPGALLRVDYLLEQMLVYSDNTASDVLIRQVGLDEVNEIARELAGADFAITSLADVRRKVYGGLHAKGAQLEFGDWVALRRTSVADRVARLQRLVGVSPEELAMEDLDRAYEAYYAAGHNSGSLRAYGALLARIATGQALGSRGTTHLLDLLTRIRTGKRRLSAVLPEEIRFAHKTGTQHRRQCDLGVTLGQRGGAPGRSPHPNVVVATCARGFASLPAAERALRNIGSALSASGVFEPLPPSPQNTSLQNTSPQDFSPHDSRRDDAPKNLASVTPSAPGERAENGGPAGGDPGRWSAGMDLQTSAP